MSQFVVWFPFDFETLMNQGTRHSSFSKGVVTAVEIFKIAQVSAFAHLPACLAGCQLVAARTKLSSRRWMVSRKGYVFRRPRPLPTPRKRKVTDLLAPISIKRDQSFRIIIKVRESDSYKVSGTQ